MEVRCQALAQFHKAVVVDGVYLQVQGFGERRPILRQTVVQRVHGFHATNSIVFQVHVGHGTVRFMRFEYVPCAVAGDKIAVHPERSQRAQAGYQFPDGRAAPVGQRTHRDVDGMDRVVTDPVNVL